MAFFRSDGKIDVINEEDEQYSAKILEAADIATIASILSAILSKIGTEEISRCFKVNTSATNGASAEEVATEVGANVAFGITNILLANYAKCQDDIFDLFALLYGKTREEIASIPLKDYAQMVMGILTKKEMKDFFSGVSKLLR